jgi:hypothetical protein
MKMTKFSPGVTFCILFVILTASWDFVDTISYGKTLTTECTTKSDIRYDASYTNNTVTQGPNWEHFAGLWRVELIGMDGESQPFQATPYEPIKGRGKPYTSSEYTLFSS